MCARKGWLDFRYKCYMWRGVPGGDTGKAAGESEEGMQQEGEVEMAGGGAVEPVGEGDESEKEAEESDG